LLFVTFFIGFDKRLQPFIFFEAFCFRKQTYDGGKWGGLRKEKKGEGRRKMDKDGWKGIRRETKGENGIRMTT